MSHNRSFSLLIGVTSAACLALPIAVTSYIGSLRASVEFPSVRASLSGPEWTVNPISDRKAKAVQEFKTTQI